VADNADDAILEIDDARGPPTSSINPIAVQLEQDFDVDMAKIRATGLTGPSDVLSLWKRRLITKEDPFSIHKISSVAYSISAIIILGTAAARYLDSPEAFATFPQSLELPSYIFSASNVVMCTASVRMAYLHRRYDITARNAFLGVAVSSLFSGFYYLWTNPYGPEIFNDHLVTQLCFAILVTLNVVFIMDTVLKTSEVIESRRDRNAEDYKGRYVVDALGYVLPIAWGLPFILPTAYVDCVLYDRVWFFEQCQCIDQLRGMQGMNAELSYLQVATSVAASFGALMPTLRDKKLISKNVELGGITVLSLPTMIWTIRVSAEFLGYMVRGEVYPING